MGAITPQKAKNGANEGQNGILHPYSRIFVCDAFDALAIHRDAAVHAIRRNIHTSHHLSSQNRGAIIQ
jgi:hypothetical protein